MTKIRRTGKTSVDKLGLEKARQTVRSWLESVVIGLNLCPFANKPYLDKCIRISVDLCTTEDEVLASLIEELSLLDRLDASETETTLLVVPNAFHTFGEYNDFLFTVDELLKLKNWEGIYQIASFHPQYQFAGTKSSDPENLTNRAPYPIFHLIREQSLTRAVDAYPDVDAIPERNIAKMNSMNISELRKLFPWVFNQ